jgi:hypothetical protein
MTTMYPIDIYSTANSKIAGGIYNVVNGNFWLNKDGSLWYRNLSGNDQPVKQLLVTELNDYLMVRLNGQTIPTISIAQLKQILPRIPKWKTLIDKINKYRHYLEI